MKKRILAVLLALLMAAAHISCTEQAGTEGETEVSADSTDAVTETEAETTEEEMLLSDLPYEDFGGETFHILNNKGDAFTDLTAEELNGEVLNDAIYNRNIQVEDLLNLTITETKASYTDVNAQMGTQLTAGDNTYRCFWNESFMVAQLAVAGNLFNVNTIEAFNFDKPWWEKAVMEEVSVQDKNYFLIGDQHFMFREMTSMVGFNKDMMDDHQLPDPYEMVREGSWTMDHYRMCMDTVIRDVDGNGKMESNDIFGTACWGYAAITLMVGGGIVFAEKNEEGLPVIAPFGDKFHSTYEKVVQTMFSNPNYMYNVGNWHLQFPKGGTLFYLTSVGALKGLRDMNYEFGIVPIPKYDEAQEEYVSSVGRFGAFCGIPTSSDKESTAVFLETFGAYSYTMVNEAYEKDTLSFKYIRDEESSEMLNLIFSTVSFNMLDAFGVNQIPETIAEYAVAGKTEIASALQAKMKAFTKLLNKAVDNLLEAETD